VRLVSAILPTRNRPHYAERAVQYFLSQTYPHRELIILDDADAPSFPSGIHKIDGIHYLRLDSRLSIPLKRNKCCEMVSGEVVMHFDDDDFSAPDRMADQVKHLEESGKQVAGYHSILFYDETSGLAYRYSNSPAYAVGTSLAYTKTWWGMHRFNEQLREGEDNAFVAAALQAKELISVDGNRRMVARVHPGNTSKKVLSGMQLQYRAVSLDVLPEGFRQ
jgi:glycosyltransferase involved in cell wall biosynthesis